MGKRKAGTLSLFIFNSESCEALTQVAQSSYGAPSLEQFKARLDEALGSLV